MAHSKLRSLLAMVVVAAMLVTTLISGLVLPVSAADVTPKSMKLSHPYLWVMTGRVRTMGASTVTYSDNKTTASVPATGITWQIADTDVATIDANGLIKPVSIGDTIITGTLPGTSISATCELHIIDGSKYVYADVPHTIGDVEFIANGDFEQGATYWGNNPRVTEGAGKDGSYGFVLSKSGDGQYYKKSLSLKPDTTYVFSYDYLPGANSSFYVEGGRFQTGRSTKTFGDSVSREWQTHTNVFTTSKSMSLSSGWDLVIKATEVDPEQPIVIDNISVREYVSALEVEKLSLSYESLRMYPGQTLSLLTYSEPYGGNLNGLVWESSNTDVATITNGVIKAIGYGTAVVTATTVNGKSASCTIEVTGGSSDSYIQNHTFDDTDYSMWKTDAGYRVRLVTVEGDRALMLGYYHPVAQTLTGLRPETTYTIKGSAKLSGLERLGIAVVSDGNVVFSKVTEQYGAAWDTALGGEAGPATASFAEGYTFTTPADFDGTVTVYFSLVQADGTPATSLKTASSTVGGGLSQGDNDVTDEEDEELMMAYAYLDDLLLYENVGNDIDLTITDLLFDGDDKGQVAPGVPVTFSVVVKNNGTDPIPAGKRFTVDFSTGTEVVRTVTYSGGVPAGGEVVISAEPWEAVEGDHMIAARVNATWDVIETHMEGNNTYQLNLRVANDRLAPTYDNVAGIVGQAGMDRLTMSDDFNSLDTVDTRASGAEGYKWYVTRPWSAPTLTVNDYMINDGVLTLMAEVPTYGIAFNSVDVKTLNGYRYQYGYLEVRLRIVRPSQNGSHEEGIPAIWSFTQDKALEESKKRLGFYEGNDTDWVELDWLEYWGVRNDWPGGYYTVTFHDSTTQPEEPVYSNSNHSMQGLGDAEWHVMGWLWEHNGVRCFLDGVEVFNLLYDAEASAVPAASAKSKTITVKNEDGTETTKTIQGKSTDPGVFSWANEEAAVLYLGGAKDNPLEIDYVRIWQESQPGEVSNDITMSESKITISEHDREWLNVTAADGSDVGVLQWKSSDPTVATVHGNGEVYARGTGTAIITATNANGVSTWCTVNVTHNLIVGADFEWENDLLHKHWQYAILANSTYAVKTTDPANANNHVLQLKPMGDKSVYYYDTPVKKGYTYRLTGKFKGTTALRMYFQSGYLLSVDDLNTTNDDANKAAGWRNVVGTSADANGWKTFTLEFTTLEEPSSWNSNYIFAFGNNKNTDCYVDDLMMTEAGNVPKTTHTLTVGAMTNGSVSLKANGSTISSGTALRAGTYVDITVAPSSGYQLALGSLEYSYTSATYAGGVEVKREVLNKSTSSFGSGNGKTFRMVMPAEDITLNAVFESISASTMPAATLGTSVFMNDDEEVSGVRFLNRLYVTDWDPNGDAVYVTYNGQKKKVTQFGALLKRAGNTEIDLTLENYEAHKNDSSATKIWKSTGCVGADVHLVDYTTAYVDFTIIMTSSTVNRYSFLDREYTTCAYVVLEDGTTLYTDAFTDSVLGALQRYEASK